MEIGLFTNGCVLNRTIKSFSCLLWVMNGLEDYTLNFKLNLKKINIKAERDSITIMKQASKNVSVVKPDELKLQRPWNQSPIISSYHSSWLSIIGIVVWGQTSIYI